MKHAKQRVKRSDIVALVILAIVWIWLIITLIFSFIPNHIEPKTAQAEEFVINDTPYVPQAVVLDTTIIEEPKWSYLVPEIQQRLSGRPLAAYSDTIAKACYETGMSPYWFCTISIVESGAGANCFRSCNAWGYGSYSWSSWEEAIPSFCASFVRGYGSGLTPSSHLTYCPSGAYYAYL